MAYIITVPNPLLQQKSAEAKLEKETLELIKQLKETLAKKEGIKGLGLSAVQIGVSKRVFIAYSLQSKRFLVFINPAIIWYSKRLTNGIPQSRNKYEGCLSVPGVWSIIKRPFAIKIRYQTEKGFPQIRKFNGFTATIIQHEYDHLEGILFTQRALEQKSKLYRLEKDENDKEVLKEIKI